MKKQKVQWYEEESGFFGPGYLREYEGILTKERTIAEVDFLESVLSLKKTYKLFDCPCGYGRHSIELARRGYCVFGQDVNTFFIQQAKKIAKSYGVSVDWVEGDIRDIKFQSEFDVVFNLFTSLGYFKDEYDDQNAIDQATKSIKPGGVFVFDSLNRDCFVRNFKKSEWRRLYDDSLILVERNFDHISGRVNEKKTRIWNDGKREEFDYSFRIYSIPEIIKMIKKAGLNFEKIYGNFNNLPLTFRSMRFVILARKT